MRKVYLKLFLLWLCGMGFALTAHGQADGTRVILKDTLAADGQTVCDSANAPEVWIKASWMHSRAFNSILKHEMAHVAQIKRFGSCWGFYKKFQEDSVFRFDSEVEAYAVQTAFEVMQGWVSAEKRQDAVIGLLLLHYDPPFPAEEVVRKVRASVLKTASLPP
jgi:hypothetical protein